MAPFSLRVKFTAEIRANKVGLNATKKPAGRGRRLGGSSGLGLNRMLKQGIHQVMLAGGLKPFMKSGLAKVKSNVKKVAVDLLEMVALGVLCPAGLPVNIGLSVALNVERTPEVHSYPCRDCGRDCTKGSNPLEKKDLLVDREKLRHY